MIFSGQVTVTTAGVAVQAGTDSAIRRYWLRAHPDNAGAIAIGGDDVTVDSGLVLASGDPPILVECALSELYVDAATGGDALCWLQVL